MVAKVILACCELCEQPRDCSKLDPDKFSRIGESMYTPGGNISFQIYSLDVGLLYQRQ